MQVTMAVHFDKKQCQLVLTARKKVKFEVIPLFSDKGIL
jgi:hypothetical protein